MAEAAGRIRVVRHEGQRFLCFCSGEGSSLRLHITNASELWSSDVTSDKQDGHLSQNGLASYDDWISKLRDTFECQAPTLSFRDSKAILQFQDGRESLTFDLHKAPLSEARKQVQDLMFSLVDQVHQLEKRLEDGAVAPAALLPLSSPEKSTLWGQSLFAPEVSPTKSRGAGSAGQGASKRRLPGESLINPGFKSLW
ncbi:protein PAXX isoform X2 [Rhineura floridana]|uniref:protein PAXX isoform X2 n=1 Tax=Rhineura floridana TaxID=261503 RepID=UPI002AC80F97|nr:protein PAXX isoform X2 [Rhineura floridana]